jgi:putative mRNA 3-end processing factor
VEKDGQVAVVSGDYKTEPDRTCTPYEPIRCHTFVTESTFGLPVYRWPSERKISGDITEWQIQNANAGRASVMLGYSLGKTQRILSLLRPALGPIFLHPALMPYTEAYRAGGVRLPMTLDLFNAPLDTKWNRSTILGPPGFTSSPDMPDIGPFSTAYMSGWMLLRNGSRGRGVDKGFPLSDHVDWPSLISAVQETGAEKVYVTHGFSKVVVRYLRETGLDAHVLPTGWEGESGGS